MMTPRPAGLGAPSKTQRRSREESGASILLGPLLALLVATRIPGSNLVLVIHAAVAVIAIVLARTVRENRTLRTLWWFALFWLAGQMVTDIVLGVSLGSVVGAIGCLTLAATTTLLWVHHSQGMDMPRVAFWFALGWVGLVVTSGLGLGDGNIWKYGLALPVLYLALAALWRLNVSTVFVVMALTAHAVVSLYFDSRFFAGLSVFTALVLVTVGLSRARMPGLGARVAVAGAIGGAYAAYPLIARSGWLGERALLQQAKYDSSGANFIVDNRAEFFQSLYLAAANRGVGVGSAQPVSAADREGALVWLARLGVRLDSARTAYLTDAIGAGRGYTPHSGLLDSVIQAGIVALPFWVLVVIVLARCTLRLKELGPPAFALGISASGATVWNLLFSPLDVATYLGLALGLYLCLLVGPLKRQRGVSVHSGGAVAS